MLALGALGQAGFAIKTGGTIAYIDPYLSDSVAGVGGPSRAVPIAIAPREVTHADVLLCTHEHIDHTDVDTLVPLAAASPNAPIFVSPQAHTILRDAGIAEDRLVLPRLGESHQIGDMRITATPAAHYDYEVDAEGHSRWMGFVVEAGGVTLYHSGDTILFPELLAALEPYRIDLALLPINGRDYFREQHQITGNLNVHEVVGLCKLLLPQVLIPTHNDMFEGNRVNPGELVAEIDRVVPRQRFHFLQAGEIYVYCG
jgi:L-ascorbate metabolism protein UlaG (beta-lactamase superfamily)